MEVVSVCPFRVASLVWQARPGAWVLTVVCKATFRLEPLVSPLAEEQEHPSDDDNHWDDDPQKSVYAPGDLVPYKTRADVLLVGNAFAPGGRAVPSLTARLVVGEVDKSLAVWGDRFWTMDGRVRDAGAVTRMSLRYERAAGGPDTINPVGVRPDVANASGEVALPNLWPLGRTPQQRGEIVEPIAFGPIAATWPSRRQKLGSLARSFSFRALAHAALPLDVDPAFFSAAPRDQQVAELHSDERILLENLHPRYERLVTNLPGVAPRVFVERANTAPQDFALRADTLWIDTDRSLMTLTWRGALPIAAADEPGRVLVGMERRDERLTWSDLAKQTGATAGGRDAPRANELPDADSIADEDVFDAGDSIAAPPPGADAASTMFLMGAPAAQTLPFAFAADANVPDKLRKTEQATAASRGQDALPAGWAPSLPIHALGADAAQTAAFPAQFQSSPGHEATAREAAFPAPFQASDAMAPRGVAAAPLPSVQVPPPLVARPAFFDAAEASPPRPEPVKEVVVADVLAKATDAGRDAVRFGVMGLSDAAVGAHRALQYADQEANPVSERAEERAAEVRSGPAEIFKLLWLDPKVARRLQKHSEWRILLAAMDLRLLEEAVEEEEEDEERSDAFKARRAVFEVLSRGAPSPVDSLRRALSEAVDERGLFEPPLVLLAGELEFTFDNIEALKATATVLTPLGPTDKRLKEALDAASDFLKTPGAEQFTRLAEGLTERLREAFAQVRRSLPVDYVDSNTDRALLRQRAYSIKTLYGKRWIRALLRGGGGGMSGGGRAVVFGGGSSGDRGAGGGEGAPPVYLPATLKDELPAYKRMRVKLLGEVDLQEDQEETAGWVVKVVALARLVPALG